MKSENHKSKKKKIDCEKVECFVLCVEAETELKQAASG